jgi:SAM-dependent methyltransferase
VTDSDARRFWDDRAGDDAFYAVDSRLEYRNPDLDRFWREGAKDLDMLLGAVGAEVSAGDDVVEIGCGVGRMTRVLARRAASVRGLDVSQRMLEVARRHNPELGNVEWILGDGASLTGVGSASADAVVSHVVFQHIPDPRITLGYVREIGRVLRPGGWAAFQVSNDPRVHRPRGRGAPARVAVQRLLRRHGDWLESPHWLGSHVEIPDLRAAAADGSMEVERIAAEGTQYCAVLLRRQGAAA